MDVRYYTNVVTGRAHIERHAVTESEVESVLLRPGEDRPGRDGTRVAIGGTPAGRVLRVVYVPDSLPDSVFVSTAYELTGKPLRAYKRRARQRNR